MTAKIKIIRPVTEAEVRVRELVARNQEQQAAIREHYGPDEKGVPLDGTGCYPNNKFPLYGDSYRLLRSGRKVKGG